MSYQPTYSASHALIIGIDCYHQCAPLSNAVRDAGGVADALVQNLSFPRENVQVFLNEQATRANILSAYHGLHEKADENDRVVVFFAGHGHSVKGNTKTQGFLVPVDADPGKLGSLIRWQEFVEGAETIPAKHILFILDACFSGLLMQRASGGGEARFVTDMLQRYSRQAITAGKADQTVGDGVDGGHSTFTHYFLEGMRGAAANKQGVLTATAAMNYAYRKVSQDASSDQTPHYGHLAGDGDMVLLLPLGDRTDQLVETPNEVPELLQTEANARAAVDHSRFAAYDDPVRPGFGLNNLTSKLSQAVPDANGTYQIVPATRFMSVVIAPSSRIRVQTKLTEVVRRLRENADGADTPPYWRLVLPSEQRTTLNTVLLFKPNYKVRELCDQILSIDTQGGIEVAASDPVVHYWQPRMISDPSDPQRQSEPTPYWRYVAAVGTLWVTLELARRVYIEVGYEAGVVIQVALVGTGNGRLGGVSRVQGKDHTHWVDPLDSQGMGQNAFHAQVCMDANIGLRYNATPRLLGGESARQIIDDFAQQFALAFNHQDEHLPCFNFGTREFPWNQFRNGWRD